jgi:cobalt-zinc-cadmium efflux system outer membrane protein
MSSGKGPLADLLAIQKSVNFACTHKIAAAASFLILLSARSACAGQLSGEAIALNQPRCAQACFKLSLADAFERAARYNKQLMASQENLAIARAHLTISKAYPNPLVGALNGFGDLYRKDVVGEPQEVLFQQTVEFPGTTMARIHQGRAERELARCEYVAAQFALHIQVRRAYAELAAAQANIELVENQCDLCQQLQQMARQKQKNDPSTQADVLQAELVLKQSEQQRILAQSRLKQAAAHLDLLIGEQPALVPNIQDNGIFKLGAQRTAIAPEITVVLWPLASLVECAYRNRMDLKVANQQAQVNRRALAYARARQVPDLLLGSGIMYTAFSKNTHVPGQQGVFVSANVELPIFYHHQGEVELAKANLRQSCKQTAAMKAQIETDVHTAYQAFLSAREVIANYQAEILPVSNQLSLLTRRTYKAQKEPISQVIVAQQQCQQTRSAYFDAVVAYQNAWADLEKAVGQPLELP